MKPTTFTIEAKEVLAAPERRWGEVAGHAGGHPPKGRDGGVVFAWSVIGFTSTLLAAGTAFFAYVFTHLP